MKHHSRCTKIGIRDQDFHLNLMAEDGSNGKRPVDDERQIDTVERQIDRAKIRFDDIDETLCNLMQMMTALIEEVRHGRREKLPDSDTNCMEKSNSEKDDDEAIDCLENSMHIDPNLQNPSGDARTDLNSLQIELNLVYHTVLQKGIFRSCLQ